MEQVEVIAIARGHCGRMVREEGDRFKVSKERLKEKDAWFVSVDAFKPRVVDPKARPIGAGPAPGSNIPVEDSAVPGAPNALA
jgi:hypothetical protein